MKKHLARVVLILLLLVQIFPLASFAVGEEVAISTLSLEPEPYERVVAQAGKWYSEQVQLEGKSKLVLQYRGEYKDGLLDRSMEFALGEKIVLRGIYLPYVAVSTEPISIQLTDEKGNTYPSFSAQPVIMDEAAMKMNYVCVPIGDIILPEGNYQMTVGSEAGFVGAFAIKGVNHDAYERYKDTIPPLGNEDFAGTDPDKYKSQDFESPPGKKPAVFTLEQDCLINEVIVNTYMDGAGAIPGTISILAEDGTVILTMQASGGSLGDTPNGMWAIAPGVLLPAGNYFVGLSDPSVITYDKSGEPLFYVKASLPMPVRYDFTGTYRINFDAIKTSTIMGPVTDTASSFSLQDFELTILDKENSIELIGKYKGIPFSQDCPIVEETENMVTAAFSASADLTKLPYKAKIGGQGTVVLTKLDSGNAQITIEGIGTFQREASKDLGADNNTYDLKSSGAMVSKDLPPFVLTALGKSGGVGNVPGPDTPGQAATGMLFPPLIGLVVSVLQDMLKPKPKAAPVVRDRTWYKKKYPNLTDEQLAMVMLADAMGNTDEPDMEDREAGDDGSNGADRTDSSGETDDRNDNDSQAEDESSEETADSDSGDEYGQQPEQSEKEAEEEKPVEETPEKKEAEKAPEEPEEMILKTSANGAESRYVKDSETGEWVNAETGNILDYEKYKSTVAQQLEDDKKFNDEQFEKISKGETAHDKALREEMQKIEDAERSEAYNNHLKSKYGTDDLEKVKEIIDENQKRAEASYEKWKEIADFNDTGDKIATGVGVIADVGVDGLSTITPYGKEIKAGYKVLKNISGTMAEKGVNWGSFTEGAIKGTADAGSDFINIQNPHLNKIAKASLAVTAESGGSAAGAAIRGGDEDWKKAAAEGAIDGSFKAIVGAATDGVAGDFPSVPSPKNASGIIPAVKNVLISKTAATKTASGMLDEFGVKPKVVQPIKDAIKPAFTPKK